jgi:hypothetical protein
MPRGESIGALGVFIALVAHTLGCMAFRGGELEFLPVVRVPEPPAAPAPSLDYRLVRMMNGKPAAVFGETVRLGQVLAESGAFGEIALHDTELSDEDRRAAQDYIERELPRAAIRKPSRRYGLVITLNARTSPTRDFVTGMLTTFTLTILPAYWRFDYEMTAVLTRGDSEIARYRFVDHEIDVIQLFMLFGMPFSDTRWGETEENMIRHLVRQMVRDGVLHG